MVVKLALKRKNENIQIWSRYSLFKNTGCRLPASSSAALNGVTINKTWQLRSIRHNFFLPKSAISDLLLRISIPKISIGPMTHSGRNMDGERCAALTQSAIVWTPPFWLVVTVLGRNCYPSMTTLLNFAKAQFFLFFFSIIPLSTARGDREEKMGGEVGLGVQTPLSSLT